MRLTTKSGIHIVNCAAVAAMLLALGLVGAWLAVWAFGAMGKPSGGLFGVTPMEMRTRLGPPRVVNANVKPPIHFYCVRGVPGRASGPRRHRVAQPGEMTNDAPGAEGMTGNTQPGCEHPEPECILEPGCRCPHCLMMEGYLIAMRRVAALRCSGHSDDFALLQRDAVYRLIRAVCTCAQEAKHREAEGNEEYSGRRILLGTLTEHLRRLTEEGGEHNFVILQADESKNYYVQFGTSCGSAVMYGEAVSDRYLRSPFTLTRAQRASLLSLGWRPPTRRKFPNFWRHWPVITAADRSAIAEVALATLQTVYGWQGGPLQIQLHLDW